MALAGIIQGIGGEAPFVEKGRQVRRQERREDAQDQIAQEELGLRRRQLGIQEQGVQQRLAELQRRLQKDQEWKSVGSAKQMKDGSWAQMQFQPESGQTRFVAVPAPEGGEFNTPADTATDKAMGKYRAYQAAKEAGANQETLDRIWPPVDRMHWMNTQQGIVGFHTQPSAADAIPPTVTPYQGYPPGYGINQPPPNSPLDETDMGYVEMLGQNRMTLDMLDKVYAGARLEPKRRLIIAEAIRRGFDPNNQLSNAASQNIATAQSQMDINLPLIQLIDQLGLKENNSPGYLMWSRMKYGAGRGTPGGLADEIANLELTKVTSAANALKGSSRAWAALSLALQHTPNVWVDSPAMIRRKLETINQRLQAVIDEQRRFGTKSGLPARGAQPIDMNGVTGTVELPGQGVKQLGSGDNTAPLEKPIAPVRTPASESISPEENAEIDRWKAKHVKLAKPSPSVR